MLLPAAAAADWPLFALAFTVGACIGSFLNVCIHRLPADESIVRPGSHCPRCSTPIAWYDNLPLVSWAWLGARCRACRARIPARHPLADRAARRRDAHRGARRGTRWTPGRAAARTSRPPAVRAARGAPDGDPLRPLPRPRRDARPLPARPDDALARRLRSL